MTDTVLLVSRNGMGTAEPDLAHHLASNFLDLLDLEDRIPSAICFYGEGVHLTCEGSPVVEVLEELAARGTQLLVCGTCLAHYELAKRRVVGEESNMKIIQAVIWDAAKTIGL